MDNNQDNKTVDLSNALDSSRDKDKGRGAIKYYQDPNAPKIVQWVIKYSGGLVKDQKQAGYVLMGFVAIIIIIAIFLFSSTGTDIEERNIFNPETAAPDINDFK